MLFVFQKISGSYSYDLLVLLTSHRHSIVCLSTVVPEISVVDQNVVPVRVGHSAHLVCQFIGYPDAIEWFRSDELTPLSADDDSESRISIARYLHEDIGAIESMITIENVSENDLGEYRCEGRNVYGSDVAVVILEGWLAL